MKKHIKPLKGVPKAARLIKKQFYLKTLYFQERKIQKVWTTYEHGPILSSVDKNIQPPHVVKTRTDRPDIVVIKLRKSFDLNKFVNPVCLPKKKVKTGAVCYASGWGMTSPLTPIDHLTGLNDLNNIF